VLFDKGAEINREPFCTHPSNYTSTTFKIDDEVAIWNS